MAGFIQQQMRQVGRLQAISLTLQSLRSPPIIDTAASLEHLGQSTGKTVYWWTGAGIQIEQNRFTVCIVLPSLHLSHWQWFYSV